MSNVSATASFANLQLSTSAIASLSAADSVSTLLTPEALLEYCKMKLKNIDSQVKTAFMKQQDRNRLSSALSDLATKLSQKASKGSGGVDENDKKTKEEVLRAYDAAIRAAASNPALMQKLEAEKAKFEATANGTDKKKNDGGVADWEMEDLTEAVQRMQSDLNRDGELEMIQLQSLMSQRQQALQMCTNMVQSLGQSAMGIVQNIGK